MDLETVILNEISQKKKCMQNLKTNDRNELITKWKLCEVSQTKRNVCGI